MDIYVQSCGLAPEHDYLWLKISKDDQSKNSPPLLKEQINTKSGKKVKLTNLYESHDLSIVLAKDGSKLLLLVTALKAIQRSKDYGRRVRNSVALLGEYKKDEPVLRMIAAKALEDWESLRDTIDKAVYFDEKLGFRVEIELIEKYIQNVRNEVDFRDFKAPDLTRKIANHSPSIKEKLAKELQECDLPKDWDGPLVIVTGNASEDVLTQHFVWRSISERVQQDKGDENWKEIPNPVEDTEEDIKKKYRIFFVCIFLLFLLITSIAILIIIKMPPSSKPQPSQPLQTTPQMKLEPLPSLHVTPQLRLQASPLPQVTPQPQPESERSQLHQETLQSQPSTEATPSSNSLTRDTTQPNPAGDTPARNLTETTAIQQVELQPINDIEQKADSKLLQQPIDKALPSELVEPPKNPRNVSGESVNPDA